jgi:hypothetical protein
MKMSWKRENVINEFKDLDLYKFKTGIFQRNDSLFILITKTKIYRWFLIKNSRKDLSNYKSNGLENSFVEFSDYPEDKL